MRHKLIQAALWLTVIGLGVWAWQQFRALNATPDDPGIFSRAGAVNFWPLAIVAVLAAVSASAHGFVLYLLHGLPSIPGYKPHAAAVVIPPQFVTDDPSVADIQSAIQKKLVRANEMKDKILSDAKSQTDKIDAVTAAEVATLRSLLPGGGK